MKDRKEKLQKIHKWKWCSKKLWTDGRYATEKI